MSEPKELKEIKETVIDNKQVIISGIVAGAILYYTVDEIETLWDQFSTYWDEKISNWSLF